MDELEVTLAADGACSLRAHGIERWRVELDLGEVARRNPFREAIVWTRAHRVVAGAGDRVHVLELATGALDATMELGSDHFGQLALGTVELEGAKVELLFVLGWTDVRAYDAGLVLRWHARNVAVDGITFAGVEGPVLKVSAEMDPPGGWFEVLLDAGTGQEKGRRPSAPDVVGR